MDEQCLICKRTNLFDIDFKAIEEEFAPLSGKMLKSVLRHILKCTQIELEIPENSNLCSKCFKFLIEYDEHVVKLMNLQKRFKIIYDNPINLNRIKPRSEINESPICSSDEMNEGEEFLSLKDTKETIDVPSDENVHDRDNGNESEDSPRQSEKPAQCEYCLELFKNTGCLQEHISQVHLKKEVTCSECGILVRDEEFLELHMNLHEGKTEYDCRYCPKRFTKKSNVIRHMHKHWDKKKYQCEKCGLRFSEIPRLYNHKLLHETEENPLICHICNQACKTRRTYKRHMNTHQEDRPRYPCQICGKTYSEKFSVKSHMRTHKDYTEKNSKRNEKTSTEATDDTVETFICIICGNVLNNREQYNKHMEDEHNVISWNNSVCN